MVIIDRSKIAGRISVVSRTPSKVEFPYLNREQRRALLKKPARTKANND